MDEQNEVPRGLVFFSPNTSPKRRFRRTAFSILLLIATVALIWPVYPLVSGIRPLILGLPLSLAWVVLWLAIVFSALIWLYRTE